MKTLGPNYKSGGPITSAMAGEKITNSGKRRRLVEIVAHLVKLKPGRTAAELADIINQRISQNSLAKRLTDARKLGLIVNGPFHRKCEITGMTVMVWYPVGSGQ